MYLRFVVAELDEGFHRRLGMFHAARYLLEDGDVLPAQREHLEKLTMDRPILGSRVKIGI